MTNDPLSPAFAKITRAETHIKNLETVTNAFFKTRPYRIVSRINADGTAEVWSVEVDRLPDEIEAITADAVHNLRSPLDKMLTIDASDASIRQIKFPVGTAKGGFERALANQEKHLSKPIIEFLEKTEAYPGGEGALLFALHHIDNGDKHHPTVVPINLGTIAKEVGSLKVWHGDLLVMGSIRGKHMIPAPDAGSAGWFVAPSDDVRPILRAGSRPDERWAEFTGPHDDMDIATTTVGAKLEAEIQPSLNLAFNEIEGFEGAPVVGVLHQMRDLVRGTLKAFKREFL